MFSWRVAIKNIQLCKSIMEADEAFKKSCNICCMDPRCQWNACNNCPVAEMHKVLIQQLKSQISAEEER